MIRRGYGLMLKICGIVLILLSSAGIGFNASSIMRLRLDELNELKKMILMLRGEIKYTRTPLGEAFAVIARRTNGIYSEFFKNTSAELAKLNGKSLSEIWQEQFKCEMMIKSHLSDKDQRWLLQLAEGLGYLDKEMQLGTIELYVEQLDAMILEGAKNFEKNSKLCKALGISAGLFLAIILI